MNNKFQSLRDMVHKIEPTIFCVQETWGKNEITDYSIMGYQHPVIIARKGTMNAGGGVGIWVKDKTEFENLDSPFTEKQIETQTILLSDLNLIIVNVYRPFGNCALFIEEFIAHITQLRTRFPTADCIVAGDFNIDLTQQTNKSDELVDNMITLGF